MIPWLISWINRSYTFHSNPCYWYLLITVISRPVINESTSIPPDFFYAKKDDSWNDNKDKRSYQQFAQRRIRAADSRSSFDSARSNSSSSADIDQLSFGESATVAPDDDSLSGIIIFSWCVVALFGIFFSLLIAAHWHWERRQQGATTSNHTDLTKTTQQKQSNSTKPTVLLNEDENLHGAGNKSKLQFDKKQSDNL